LFIITVLLMTGTAVFAYFFPQQVLTVDTGDVTADAIVVLGGGLHERPVRAAQLFKEHVAPRIILTGYGDDQINRRILVGAGVPANVIEVEPKSRTTQENALFTAKLLHADGIRRAILVTSWYHSRRALKCFEHDVPGITFYSRPSYFAFKAGDWKGRAAEVRKRVYLEYIKLPGYWVRYGVNPF
jgi:uncharacterized SAM-binding protein YcdF (DUF218 family)